MTWKVQFNYDSNGFVFCVTRENRIQETWVCWAVFPPKADPEIIWEVSIGSTGREKGSETGQIEDRVC